MRVWWYFLLDVITAFAGSHKKSDFRGSLKSLKDEYDEISRRNRRSL